MRSKTFARWSAQVHAEFDLSPAPTPTFLMQQPQMRLKPSKSSEAKSRQRQAKPRSKRTEVVCANGSAFIPRRADDVLPADLDIRLHLPQHSQEQVNAALYPATQVRKSRRRISDRNPQISRASFV